VLVNALATLRMCKREHAASAIEDEDHQGKRHRVDSAATIAREYSVRGVCCLRDLVAPSDLELLRCECDALRAASTDADLLSADCVVDIPPGAALPDDHRARRDAAAYILARGRPTVESLLLGTLPAAAAAALGGSPPLLFNEHYVCKPARIAGAFRWHTDAAHQLEALLALLPPSSEAAERCCEYVSLWVALDDIDGQNGALTLLPRDTPQPPHAACTAPASFYTSAWLDAVGAPVHGLTTCGMRAGDALLFSSTLWHASAPNTSDAARRAYYVQYSSSAIGAAGAPLALAVPTAPVSERLARVQLVPLRKAESSGRTTPAEFD
jgi:hypothetical protein